MSVCIMQHYISETWPPILMKLGMKFTHIHTMVRGKFHLISPINKNFTGTFITWISHFISIFANKIFVYGWNQMKLSTNQGWNMGELHAKFHQSWWSGFRDILLHYTDWHSFIIIRILDRKGWKVHIKHTFAKCLSFISIT